MDITTTDKTLIAESWTSPDLYKNLETLCDFGSRFAGSPGGRAARDFILGKFRAYGVSNPRTEPFDFLVWTRGECTLSLRAPIAREREISSSSSYAASAATPAAQASGWPQ